MFKLPGRLVIQIVVLLACSLFVVLPFSVLAQTASPSASPNISPSPSPSASASPSPSPSASASPSPLTSPSPSAASSSAKQEVLGATKVLGATGGGRDFIKFGLIGLLGLAVFLGALKISRSHAEE
ncbi:hypothetical protein HYS93_05010 [Candidatus Daviesbacteria bacterium]|nr:hypothetical protein [Candidatus Daviesbacteria bacterium]